MFAYLKELKLLEWASGGADARTVKYPGLRDAVDGNSAVIHVEREASDAAGAYPITPSTQMGEYWAEAVSQGHLNISQRPLIFIEPESEHAAAGVTAGMAMAGLRATNFSSAQGVAFMHESLYAAVGKRLPYVLNMGCRAMTKASLNVHCGHDDYHCVDDTGFIQVMARNAQEAADLNLIARKTAELALTPAVVGQDGFLTTHLIESALLPERELVAEFLGRPDDLIATPTPAQQMLYGPTRRRVPALWDVDTPLMSGTVQNQDAYMQAVAAQRPYFFDHIESLADQAMAEYGQLTGRQYHRVNGYGWRDAEYLILGMGSMIVQAEAVADHLRQTRKLKVGVINLTMYRPFPGAALAKLLQGKRGVAVLERTDQPLAEDLPLMREVRAALGKCLENGVAAEPPHVDYPAYGKGDMPRLYSGCYGLGSRDLQPEALIAAVENMLPEGGQRPFFYLSVDFVRDQPAHPQDELHHQALLAAYPRIRELALKGSENPDLMPQGAICVRMHSIGGWGAITTGKNLAVTLFELLGYHIKANPKYGSEKKGQPTTYYLAAAPEAIRVNCEYVRVDVVLSPDPNVFGHSNPLAGLRDGGVFIIQSDLDSAGLWASLPSWARQTIVDKHIRLYHLDAFRIAREEAGSVELQLRMQGNAFQGAFFAAVPLMAQAGLTGDKLFAAIEDQLRHKFGAKGERVVADNLRVVRRGLEEMHEVLDKHLEHHGATPPAKRAASLPLMLKNAATCATSMPKSGDLQSFWQRTGHFYATGRGGDNLADPFLGVSIMPAATGVLRDLSGIRFTYPEWDPEKCTACGKCFTCCPDSALPGLVSTPAQVFETALRRIETGGQPTRYLRRALRGLEKKLRQHITEAADLHELLDQAEAALVAEAPEAERIGLAEELGQFRAALGDFRLAVTRPYWINKEKKAAGSGGLFSLTVNPQTCKACGLCATVCEDGALSMAPQTPDSLERLRRDWSLWRDLPTTSPEFERITNLDDKIGALETLLLDKRVYDSMACGDGACLGCGEKTAIRLFTATVSALMQPRVRAQVARLDQLILDLEAHIRARLTSSVDWSDTDAMLHALKDEQNGELTLASLSARMEAGKPSRPIDPDWLRRTASLLDELKDLRWRYQAGPSGRGRSPMGMVNSTGCTSVWGATWPYNPYPFPWTNHLFQDAPSVAMGLFEGHMARMADGFKAVRRAEMELAGQEPQAAEDFFRRFDWRQFNDEEWKLCPPVVAMGGDGAMYDIGFQNLSRAMMSGLPIKVLVLDTQVYSNTGGQACTSGFMSQVSDMAPYGEAVHGKREIRKEMSLIAMAHRSAFVLQSTVGHVTHLLEGFIDGLNSRRPAIFNLYAVCPPEHGVGDDQSVAHSKLAVESRAYPLFRFDPDADAEGGCRFSHAASLAGNPAPDQDWPRYRLRYLDESGLEQDMELAMTFADFAAGETRFARQFKKAPPETWNDTMLPLADFLELDATAQQGRYPYIWAVDVQRHLIRLLPSAELVQATLERRDFWRQLRDVVGQGRGEVDQTALSERIRDELLQRIAGSLGLGQGLGLGLGTAAAVPVQAEAAALAPSSTQDYEPCWVETPECTGCNECLTLAPGVFAYNGQKQASVANAKGASYADLVRAAEKCSAGCLHPGTPWNPSEPGLAAWVARAERLG